MAENTNGAIDWTTAIDAATTAERAVSSGSTMHHQMKGLDHGYRVFCTVEIENWTKYPLMDPESNINGGTMRDPPVVVFPGKREQFTVHKFGFTATGTHGTTSWLISGANRRVVVMWSCPFNFDFYSNWLCVGLTTEGVTFHQNWFDQMYYKQSGGGLNFQRGEYYSNAKTLSHKDHLFEVTGIMGSGHNTNARIVLRPLQIKDLAAPLDTQCE